MLTYQVIVKLTENQHFTQKHVFLTFGLVFSNFLRTFAVPKRTRHRKDEFDPILLLIPLCGEQDRVFSCYMNSP